ncbi:MAG: hypothetical protein RMX96_02885 [Nostoc sp. ChiSLP02]|nr:hypothetical protein [Nostoc sp. DedSLP05]MDZ8097709.1 hypothetical protein [Nostoc sp. DedSLP01]MDZ8183794.1 hypothetical protein [Nostoc sp. ChiSLP02]
MQLKRTPFLIVLFLLIIASLCYLPFTYKDTPGERDGFRMVMGIIDSVISGKPLGSPLLYGRSISYGYYVLIDIFRPIFQKNFNIIIPITNYISSFSSILIVIPVFYIVKRYWGVTTALLANLLLIFIPVWWSTSLYGHPMIQAVLFMFVGLALIGYRSEVKFSGGSIQKLILLDISIIFAFSLCLMFRLDAALMFLLIPACLLIEGYSFTKAVYHSSVYIIFPIIIFFAIKSQLPEIATGSDGIVEDLIFYHGPDRMLQNFKTGTVSFIKGCNPLYIFISFISFIYLCFQRDYLALLFVFPTLILNYIFWMPNHYPARHFIYMAPVLAIGNAIWLQAAISTVLSFRKNKTIIAFGLSLISILLVFVSYKNSYSPPYPYWQNQTEDNRRLAKNLYNLPSQGQRIFVIADSIPVVLEMQLLSRQVIVKPLTTSLFTDTQLKYQNLDKILKVKPTKTIDLLEVKNENNNFIFYIQGWKKKEVVRFFQESNEYDDVSLVIQKNIPSFTLVPSDLSKKFNFLDID